MAISERLKMKSMYEAKSVAELVTFVMETQNISYEKLGDDSGVGRSTLWRWVKGETVPIPEQLDKLAAHLHVSRAWLYRLHYGIETGPSYSPSVMEVAGLLESLPEDVQDLAADLIRTIAIRSQKDQTKQSDD